MLFVRAEVWEAHPEQIRFVTAGCGCCTSYAFSIRLDDPDELDTIITDAELVEMFHHLRNQEAYVRRVLHQRGKELPV